MIQVTNSARAAFSARFREALIEAGYEVAHYAELGALFGVTGQAVRKWLNEEAIPNSSRAAGVAETLGVRRSWLLDGELPMRPVHTDISETASPYKTKASPGKPATGLSISGEEFRLLQNYRSLPKPLRETVETMLQTINQEIGSKRKRKP